MAGSHTRSGVGRVGRWKGVARRGGEAPQGSRKRRRKGPLERHREIPGEVPERFRRGSRIFGAAPEDSRKSPGGVPEDSWRVPKKVSASWGFLAPRGNSLGAAWRAPGAASGGRLGKSGGPIGGSWKPSGGLLGRVRRQKTFKRAGRASTALDAGLGVLLGEKS